LLKLLTNKLNIMNANTVVLNLKDYLELKDFKENIEKSECLIVEIPNYWNRTSKRTYFVKKDEIEENLLNDLKLNENAIKDLKEQLKIKEETLKKLDLDYQDLVFKNYQSKKNNKKWYQKIF